MVVLWRLSWWCEGCHGGGVEVVMVVWRLSWWCGGCHGGGVRIER